MILDILLSIYKLVLAGAIIFCIVQMARRVFIVNAVTIVVLLSIVILWPIMMAVWVIEIGRKHLHKQKDWSEE